MSLRLVNFSPKTVSPLAHKDIVVPQSEDFLCLSEREMRVETEQRFDLAEVILLLSVARRHARWAPAPLVELVEQSSLVAPAAFYGRLVSRRQIQAKWSGNKQLAGYH